MQSKRDLTPLQFTQESGSMVLDLKNSDTLKSGKVAYTSSDGGRVSFKVTDKTIQEVVLEKPSPDIVLDPNTTKDASGKILNGVLKLTSLGLTFYVSNGKVSKDSQGNGISSKELSEKALTSYLFGNGFNNKQVPEGVADSLIPPFIKNLEGDGVIGAIQEYFIKVFETTNLFGNAVAWGSDIVLKLQDKEFFKQVLLGEASIALPQPIFGWFKEGIQNSLVNEIKKELMALENQKNQRIKDAIAFAHSGFFAPLLRVLEQKRPDGSQFDVQTIISYEGPEINWDRAIDNPNLKRIINVWGTASVADGDFGPPGGQANFKGIDNINIEIKGAFHNDFSYDPSNWDDKRYAGKSAEQAAQLKAKDQERNRKVNLFMRRLYEFALADQTKPGDLNGYLESLKEKGIAKFEGNIWKIELENLPG